MTTITSLLEEIISFISEYENIDLEDVISFESTWTRSQELIQDKDLWIQEYFDRYAWMEERRNTAKWKKFLHHLDCKQQIIAIIKRIKNLQDYPFAIYKNESLTTQKDIIKKEFDKLTYFMVADPKISPFITSELSKIYSEERSRNFAMCTNIFDYNLILRRLNDTERYKNCSFRHLSARGYMNRYINEIEQYTLPHVSYSIQNAWLDDIKQEILSRLKNKYPTHPIFWICLEKPSLCGETNINDTFNDTFWKPSLCGETNDNINDTFWNDIKRIQIVETLDEYVFSKVMLRKLDQLWQKLDPEDYHNYESAHIKDCILYATYYTVANELHINYDSSVDLLDQFQRKKKQFSLEELDYN